MGKMIEGILHMVGGAGETSYASNSKFPEKVLHMAKPILEEAIGRVYTSLLPERMAVVDLGCSSGSTTLEVVSEVLDVIGKLRRSLGRQEMPEILFFLNDLPGNDFNHVFRSLGDYKRKVEEEKGNLLVPYYVVGVPGSFYGRLFPSQSVHFFNASSCLNWLSQVPEGEQGVLLNNKNIYVAETSPLEVVKAYQDQRQRDLSEFLRCRHAELSYGARMVLSFVGRKRSYPPWGDMGYLFGLLAEALSALVSQVPFSSFLLLHVVVSILPRFMFIAWSTLLYLTAKLNMVKHKKENKRVSFQEICLC
ncbi:anthranilate O-methyltransferase 2-like isoform X1 [Musa acuminata AAA Group]|uniref:anthranilate O-methyltransferase 2-like isoform X1 n=1 Tax=Musa acuminata AAA Group TaxID=214697 RepID=UPI0031D0C6EE